MLQPPKEIAPGRTQRGRNRPCPSAQVVVPADRSLYKLVLGKVRGKIRELMPHRLLQPADVRLTLFDYFGRQLSPRGPATHRFRRSPVEDIERHYSHRPNCSTTNR